MNYANIQIINEITSYCSRFFYVISEIYFTFYTFYQFYNYTTKCIMLYNSTLQILSDSDDAQHQYKNHLQGRKKQKLSTKVEFCRLLFIV